MNDALSSKVPNTNEVWEEMKRAEMERLAENNIKTKPRRTAKKKKKKRRAANAVRPVQPAKHSPKPTSPAPASAPPVSPTTTEDNVSDLKTSIVAWSKSANPSELALGDSDDEDEDVDDDVAIGSPATITAPSTREWTMTRFCSAISSTDLQSRLNGLQALRLAIDELLIRQQPSSVPQLALPPPYDPSSISLTHHEREAVVSDMSSQHWSQWDRTHASMMSQFRSLSTGDGTSTNGSGNDDDAASSCTQLQALLNGCGCDVFRRFGDAVERCRALSIRCVEDLALSGIDFGRHIGLLMPAVLARFPPASFDAEMNVFVHNADDHDTHRRGGAVARQDRDDSRVVAVVETSEEIRLALCNLLSSLIRGAMAREELSTLQAYFADIILALFTMLRDPCPEVKIAASQLLTQVVRIPHWEGGAKIFALALARASMANLRHRNARVRLVSIELFEASVCVPNRAKVRGAGTDAIADLIGFKEDNVIPIAAYYSAQCSVSVNVLAELAVDKNPKVRERCCQMLAYLMVCLPDRYDHQTRLLPYLINLHLDVFKPIQKCSLDAIEALGAQYEAENPQDIIERRQYGVDGDVRCSHSELPPPFQGRPSLGARLFVRTNTRRFLTALLVELSSWRSKTKEQSAELLRMLIVYNEEHLVGSMSMVLPLLVKGLKLAVEDVAKGDRATQGLVDGIEACLELLGRYIPRNVYEALLPDAEDKSSQHKRALECMAKGSEHPQNE